MRIPGAEPGVDNSAGIGLAAAAVRAARHVHSGDAKNGTRVQRGWRPIAEARHEMTHLGRRY